MDGDAGLKVAARGPHLDGDGEALEHLVAHGADAVEADDGFVVAAEDELETGADFVVGVVKGVEHRGEAGLFDGDLVAAVLGDGLGFGEADGADGWMREDDGRDGGVFEAGAGFAAEEAVGEATAGGDSDGCEFVARRRRVADGVDAVGGGVLVGVDLDEARGVQFDGRWQIQLRSEGIAARGEDHDVEAVEGLTVGEVERLGVFGVDARGRRSRVQDGAVGFHGLHELIDDERIETVA
mmetsp:Transcript_9059/g.22975  ORF Transcript_9059/g.22975 Transcript_9059/m.22975 type:complete len:239 (-) Transcript_9059:582-1298(-)